MINNKVVAYRLYGHQFGPYINRYGNKLCLKNRFCHQQKERDVIYVRQPVLLIDLLKPIVQFSLARVEYET